MSWHPFITTIDDGFIQICSCYSARIESEISFGSMNRGAQKRQPSVKAVAISSFIADCAIGYSDVPRFAVASPRFCRHSWSHSNLHANTHSHTDHGGKTPNVMLLDQIRRDLGQFHLHYLCHWFFSAACSCPTLSSCSHCTTISYAIFIGLNCLVSWSCSSSVHKFLLGSLKWVKSKNNSWRWSSWNSI